MSTPTLPQPVDRVDNEIKMTREAISRAKISLMGKKGSVFITSVAFSLKYVLTEDVARAATDGFRVYFNPKWFLIQRSEHQVGTLVHEVWHVCLNHCKLALLSRMGERDPYIWNVACDALINQFMIEAGFQLPEDRVDMPQYKGWTAEAVYDDLMQNVTLIPVDLDSVDLILDPTPGKGDKDEGVDEKGQAPSDQDMPGKQADPAQSNPELERILLRATTASQMAGEGPGSMPGDAQFILDTITNPKLPWNRILQRHCTALAKSTTNWLKPRRRYYPKHYLPSTGGNTLNRAVVAIDMSYSCTDEQVTQFIGEFAGIITQLRPQHLDLMEFDTEIKNLVRIRHIQDLKKHVFIGRGGTDVRPVLEWADENKPDVIIIFTDGEFWIDEDYECSVPVVWIIYNDPTWQCRFGKIIHVEL